jgi:hypothetical protein
MSEVEQKILKALTGETPAVSERLVFKEISHEEKKQYLCKNVNLVEPRDREDIGQILIMNGKKSWIKDGSEGCMIHLDNMNDPNVVNQMYNLLCYKLSKKQPIV